MRDEAAGAEAPRPSALGAWWLAIRPKTLSASIAPVAVGAALAYDDGTFALLPVLAALAGALLIQIGTNLSNDVLDWRKGADTEARVGPTRVVQAGLLSPRAVTLGATLCFGLAALVGLYLVSVGGWPILALGLAAILSGVAYTAGPYPLAYVGLGDLFVMLFFGVAAVAGTYYVQALELTPAAVGLGVAVGALSVALLTINNLRDIDQDAAADKRTLVVRMGEARARVYFELLLVLGIGLPVLLSVLRLLPPTAMIVLFSMFWVPSLVWQVRGRARGAALLPALAGTARLQAIHAALLVAALLIDGLVTDPGRFG